MEAFLAISGSIIWILALFVVILFIANAMLDKWIAHREDERRALNINARKELGSDIKRQAYWVNGSEYDTVPPYVVIDELGKQIEETSHVDMDKLRNVLFEARDKHNDEFVQNVKKD